jgi:DNA-binding NtrC family response regulator
VLQEREFERVGGVKRIKLRARVIAATHRNLSEEVAQGRFREDLYQRLKVITLLIPPLRERRDDIPLLAAHFAAKAAEKHHRPPAALDPALVEALQEYDWPGNVRELENLMERLVVLSTGARLGTEFLPDRMLHLRRPAMPDAHGEDDETTLEGAVIALRRRLLINAMQIEGGNKAAAAKRLGISRSYLHRLISELEL